MKLPFLKPLLLLLTIGLSLPTDAQEADNKHREKLGSFMQILDYYYKEDVDHEKVTENAIKGVLKELDPHSVYYSRERLKKANEPLVGSFEGVGIQFNILNDTIFVISSIPGGPSEKLGIMPGDKIVYIEEETVAGIGVTNEDVIDKLRGDKGTQVTVKIKRKGTSDLLDYTITRDKIPLFSVDASYMVDDKVGYVKLNRFSRTTGKEVREALTKLNEQGMQRLIFDLRGNGGGFLNEAVNVADEFLGDGKMIVYTEGRAFDREDRLATARGLFEEGQVIVLINEGSASASEIVSGAVQDWDRGLVVGRRSFGKGLVQRTFKMPDGSAVRLTVSDYYTPSGRSIQKPYEEGVDAYRKELKERQENGELIDMSNIEFPDSLKFNTLSNKRTVFGGGGIMPDIFVPLDTTRNSSYFRDLRRKGILNKFALNYVDDKRDAVLAEYTDYKDFAGRFKVDQSTLDKLIAFASKEEIEFKQEEFDTSKELIVSQLRGLIARNLYDRSAMFFILNQEDPTVTEAMKLFTDGTFDRLNIAY